MSLVTQIWDLSAISLTISGVPITGAGQGSFIKITRTSDAFSKVSGLQGDVVRNKMLDKSADAELTVLGTSGVNILLSALLNADMDAPGGVGAGAFFLEDPLSGTQISGECWLSAFPEIEITNEVPDFTWKIGMGHCRWQIGGRA